MGKKIVLAELDLDTKGLLKAAADTKKQMEELEKQQQKLSDKGKENSKEYLALEAALKQLQATQKMQQAAITAQVNEEGKLLSQKKAIKDAVKEQNQTETDYIANNERLLALKRNLNTTDDDYEKKLGRINAKLLENTNWLKENGSENAKLVTTMNDYKAQVLESFDSINIFNGGLSGLVSRAQEAGGTGPLLKNAFNGITGGIGGMTKAAWGFVSNPIGAILTALVLVVQGLVGVFKNFTPVVDKVEQVMAAVGAVFESVKNSVIGLVTGATSLGDFFSGFVGSAAEAATEAANLTKAQQELADAMEVQEVANEKAKNQIDELITKSKDMSLSEQERADAVKQAAKVEEDTYKKNMDLANRDYQNSLKKIATGKNLTDQEKKRLNEEGFAYAKLLQEKKAISDEELDALKSAEQRKLATEREGIARRQKMLDERAAEDARRLEEEQRKKDEALRRDEERERKRLQMLTNAAERQKLLLDQFLISQGAKAKSLQEELKMNDDILKKKIAVADAELKANKENANAKLQHDNAVSQAKLENLQANASATERFATAEYNLWAATAPAKKDLAKNLTQALVEEEVKRLDDVQDHQLKLLEKVKGTNYDIIEEKILNNQALSEKDLEYLTEKARIDDEHTAGVKEANKALADQKAAQETAELEVKRAQATTDYEQQMADEEIRYQAELTKLEERKQQGLISEQQYNALKEAEDNKHANNRKAIEKSVMDNKLSLASTTFGNLATIMGKESAAGKAMAVAQATIDTYKSAVSAYGAMAPIPMVGPALGAVAAAAAVAAGIANVKKITSTKAPKAEKGALFGIGGRRHSQGGTMFTGEDGTRFEAEQGELIGVMNRNAARHFMAFNNTFPAGQATAPNYFASGGIVSREIAPQGLNTDELAAKIAHANMMIPAPVVAVQDILAKSSSHVQVRDAANF